MTRGSSPDDFNLDLVRARVREEYGLLEPPEVRWTKTGAQRVEDGLHPSGHVEYFMAPPKVQIPLLGTTLSETGPEAYSMAFKARKCSIVFPSVEFAHFERSTNTLCIHYIEHTRVFTVWEEQK